MKSFSALLVPLLILAYAGRAGSADKVGPGSQARLSFAGDSKPKPQKVKPPKPAKPPRPQPLARLVPPKTAFRRANPCPATGLTSGPCPGYVIDYINPIACGGTNTLMNLQWDTVEQAKVLRKWERSGCKSER